MYHSVFIKLIELWGKKDGIFPKRYTLFLEYLFSVVVNIVFAAALGHTFRIEKEMIVFAVCYTILRVSNGGNYLKINIKNVCSAWGAGVIILYAMKFYACDMIEKDAIYAILLICILCVGFLVPHNIQNLELGQILSGCIYKRSIATVLAESVCILLGMFFVDYKTFVPAVIGLLMQSISLVSGIFDKEQIVEQRIAEI